jgi:hypothetical protein
MEPVIVSKEEAGAIDRRGRPEGTGKYYNVGGYVVDWVNSSDYPEEVLKIPLKDAKRAIMNMRTSTSFRKATASVAGKFKICVSPDNDAALFVAKNVE